MTAPQNDSVIRPIDPDRDLDQLLPLFELVFGVPLSREEWIWKYLPPWTKHPNARVGYVGDQLVGHVGAVPIPGLEGGRETPFFQVGDLMIHPDHRGQMRSVLQGAKAFLNDIAESCPRHVLYGFTKHRALVWFQHMGFPDLVEMAPHLIVRPGSASDPRVEVVPWSWNSPGIDPLWERLKPMVQIGLIRDSRYLQWRYDARPNYQYRILGVTHEGSAAGWLIVRASDKELQGPRSLLNVVDLLLDPALVPAAVDATARHLQAESMLLWLPSRFSSLFPENRESSVQVMYARKPEMLSVADLRAQLYYTMGDADWN